MMAGILGSQPQPRGILGGFNPLRQIKVPFGQPVPASPMGMGQGGPPEYGSDEWALAMGGPGAMFWRELVRGMSSAKNPMNVFDPSKAGRFFSPETIGSILGDKYQAGAKSKGK